MNKKFTIICLLTFLLGCAGGGVLAYANHQKGLESQSLIASISQTQSDWEVEQFIREQEEQRPEGLEESQIATGSRYTGITYNNVSVATEKKEEEWKTLLEKLQKENAPLTLKQLALSGKDLLDVGVPPHRVSETLQMLLNHAVCNPKDNVKARLIKIVPLA